MTDTLELQYLIREIAREMNANLPDDLSFVLMIFHKGDGAVGWATREDEHKNPEKIRRVVRDWLERSEKMEVKSEN
jgi:hypothetical protein